MTGIEIILDSLNDKQKEAVKSENKRTLILAGAGSGKTKVLTSRVAYLISLGVAPTSILSVTFTNKAAGEMKARIVKTLKEINPEEEVYERDLSVGTFHSISSRWLRRYSAESGLSKDFTIIDQDEQKSFLKEIIVDKLGYGREATTPKEKTKIINQILKTSLSMIGSLKDEGIRPDDGYKFTGEDYQRFGFDFKNVYKKYEEEREKSNLLDFGDLILYMVELLKSNTPIRNMFKEEYRHILVDEFQDTNKVQADLIDLLHDEKDGYLFVVGDDDQSIYEWRGANIENILNFDQNYKDVKTVRLEQNYRSTNNILKCANGLIERNKKRKGKNLWSDKDEGELVHVNIFDNAYEEADRVAKEIKKGISMGISPIDYAILYRSNHMSRIIEGKLSENQIAYTIIGGTGFWSRMEVKDLMSYLTLCVNKNNNMAFDRVVNTPARSIGKKKQDQIKERANLEGISRFEALESLLIDGTFKETTQIGRSARKFVKLINKVSNSDLFKLEDKMSILLDGSGLVEYYKDKDEEKGDERESNLVELLNASKHFKNETPEIERDEIAFISYAILQSTADKETEGESVPMMTIHAAKGLEFKRVYAIGWEDGMFPSDNAIKEGKIEEERRLAYVAITRAEEKLTISYANADRFSGASGAPASRFIHELPPEQVKMSKITRNNGGGNYYKPRATNNWNKERVVSGYKIGSNYESKQYGTGIILGVVSIDDKFEIKVKFGGMIGIKRFLLEKK